MNKLITTTNKNRYSTNSVFKGILILILLTLANIIWANNNILNFIPPLPTIPAQMTAKDVVNISYNIVNNAAGKVYQIATNYDSSTGIITRIDKCTELAQHSSCAIKLQIAPKNAHTTLPLHLEIYANAASVFLEEPTTHMIEIIDPLPSITKQPQDQKVITGKTVTFSVEATSTLPLHYQWFKDGQKVGNDSNTYVIAIATAQDVGSYAVEVANSSGKAMSNSVALKVGDTPTITSQLKNQTILAGSAANITIGVTGTPPLHYNWTKNGKTLEDDSNTFYIPKTKLEDRDSYIVEIANEFGKAISNSATLQVGDAPVITTQPLNQTVASGNQITFSVVATGTPPLHYTWYKENTLVGEDSATFTINRALFADASRYKVIVSNDFGKKESDQATLTVKGSSPVILSSSNHNLLSVDKTVTQGKVIVKNTSKLVAPKFVIKGNIEPITVDNNSSCLRPIKGGETCEFNISYTGKSSNLSRQSVVFAVGEAEPTAPIDTMPINLIDIGFDTFFNPSFDDTQAKGIFGSIYRFAATYKNGVNFLYAITSQGIFKTSDEGENWTLINSDLPKESTTSLTSLWVDKSNIYVGTKGYNIFKSADGGTHWKSINNGLTTANIQFLYASNNTLYAGTDSSVFKTTDEGEHWTPINNGLTGQQVQALIAIGNALYAGTNLGVFKTIDGGEHWTKTNYQDCTIKSLAAAGDTLYAGVDNSGVFIKTIDGGANWVEINIDIDIKVEALWAIDHTLYVGTTNGVYKAADGDKRWILGNNNLSDKNIKTIYSVDRTLYIGTSLGYAYKGSRDILFWGLMNIGLPQVDTVLSLAAIGDNLSAAITCVPHSNKPCGFFLSKNGVDNWMVDNDGIGYGKIKMLYVKKDMVYAGTTIGGYKSKAPHFGYWQSINRGLKTLNVQGFASIGDKLYMGTYLGGILETTNEGDQWTSINNGLKNLEISSLYSANNTLYTATTDGWVYKTIDAEDNWTTINTMLPSTPTTFSAINNTLYVGTLNKGIFKTIKGDDKWIQLNNGLNNSTVRALSATNNLLYAGTDAGIFRLVDGEENWTLIDKNLDTFALHQTDNIIYAATPTGIFKAITSKKANNDKSSPSPKKNRNKYGTFTNQQWA